MGDSQYPWEKTLDWDGRGEPSEHEIKPNSLHSPVEVFADYLRERATAVIVAHKHPSGNLLPSNDDRNITKLLQTAGDLLGIQVLDHLIFSDEALHSILEENEF